MNWETESAPAGPSWIGREAIYNVFHGQRWPAIFAIVFLTVTVLGLVIAAVALPFLKRADRRAALEGFPMIAAGGDEKFVGLDWRLTFDEAARVFDYQTDAATGADRLLYGKRSRSGWSVGLDDITGVEAGRTNDWEASRRWYLNGESAPAEAVPAVEFQTYFMTRTGRRLVFHTANGGREDCSALALSVRAVVEASRTSAAPVAASAPSPAPAEKGFSL